MADKLDVTEALSWLKSQELLYASHPASDDQRLRMTYRPAEQIWKVTVGIGGVNKLLYAGDDINRAIEVFNEY